MEKGQAKANKVPRAGATHAVELTTAVSARTKERDQQEEKPLR